MSVDQSTTACDQPLVYNPWTTQWVNRWGQHIYNEDHVLSVLSETLKASAQSLYKVMPSPKVAVVGANSMIGRAVIRRLNHDRYTAIPIVHTTPLTDDIIPSHKKYEKLAESEKYIYIDLLTTPLSTVLSEFNVDYIINLAGYNGGIKKNAREGLTIFSRNSTMAANVFQHLPVGLKKIVTPLPSCIYAPSEFDVCEADVWYGSPHESVACHGAARRNTLMYNKLLDGHPVAVSCILNTVYGPHDHFGEDAKVVGALIEKVYGQDSKLPVELYGTGEESRTFIYCDDAADAIIECMEKYNDFTSPVNVPGEEVKIKDLFDEIANNVDHRFGGQLAGQSRKNLDTYKWSKFSSWEPKIDIIDGISRTVKWFKSQYAT